MNNGAFDAWKILGIEPTQSEKEIKKAYSTLARQCHPEEKPEEFERLSVAYKAALSYVKRLVVIENATQAKPQAVETATYETKSEADKVKDAPKNEEGELLALMEEEKRIQMAEALSNGIVKDICELLENEKLCNKPAAWQELFLRDEFLDVQCDNDFLEQLAYYLVDYTEGFTKPLPQAFMTEIAIVYVITLYEDGYAFEEQYVNGQILIAQLWNRQPEEWIVNRGSRILMRDANEARRRAYQGYFDLKFGCILGEISVDRIASLELWDARTRNFYELNRNGKELLKYQASAIIIKLYDYLLRKKIMPFDLVCYFYDEWKLRELEGNSQKKIYYQDIKKDILTIYPDIEYKIYNDEETEKLISKWVYSISKFQQQYNDLCDQGLKYLPEPETITEGVRKCFEDTVWQKYIEHPFMMEMWDKEYLHFHYRANSISKELYKGYNDRKFDKNPTVQKLLVKITWAMLLDDRKNGIEIDRFWPCFMMYGFGITSMYIGEHKSSVFDNIFIRENRIYLPEYVNFVYGMEDYTPKCEEYEFDLGIYGRLGMKCNMHSIEYMLNGESIYPRSINYEKFVAIVTEVNDAKAFFALFALADIDMKHRDDAKKLVRQWLYKTSILEGNYEVISECLVNGDDIWKNATKFIWEDSSEQGLLIREAAGGAMTYKYSTMGWLMKME